MSTIKPSVAERYAEHVPYHRPRAEIERIAAATGRSPTEDGTIEMIVCRPATDERRVLPEGVLDTVHGLRGDTWEARGAAHRAQLTARRHIRCCRWPAFRRQCLSRLLSTGGVPEPSTMVSGRTAGDPRTPPRPF